MKKSTAAAALVLLAGSFGASAAFAGGAACAEKHTQASYAEMEKKYAAHGWLGVETERVSDGRYAVTSVALGSPAEKAGFQKGDVMVALNGARFGDANKEKVKAAKAGLAPGKAATYTIERSGSEKQLTATLTDVPKEVIAKWIDEHKATHEKDTVASN
jgi:C-terminal processing protease CtpA/Prc